MRAGDLAADLLPVLLGLALGLWWYLKPEQAHRFYATFGQRYSPALYRALGFAVLVFMALCALMLTLDRIGLLKFLSSNAWFH